MLGPYLNETLTNWAADFSHGDGITLFPVAVQGEAQAVLGLLLVAACEHRGVEPAALVEDDLKHALLGPIARLPMDAETRPFIPSLCRSYLEDLQRQGRAHSLGSSRVIHMDRHPEVHDHSGAAVGVLVHDGVGRSRFHQFGRVRAKERT